jgi:hypothetical protein
MYTDLIESTTHILMGKESQITRWRIVERS